RWRGMRVPAPSQLDGGTRGAPPPRQLATSSSHPHLPEPSPTTPASRKLPYTGRVDFRLCLEGMGEEGVRGEERERIRAHPGTLHDLAVKVCSGRGERFRNGRLGGR